MCMWMGSLLRYHQQKQSHIHWHLPFKFIQETGTPAVTSWPSNVGTQALSLASWLQQIMAWSRIVLGDVLTSMNKGGPSQASPKILSIGRRLAPTEEMEPILGNSLNPSHHTLTRSGLIATTAQLTCMCTAENISNVNDCNSGRS